MAKWKTRNFSVVDEDGKRLFTCDSFAIAAQIVSEHNSRGGLVEAGNELYEFEDDMFDKILDGDLGSIKTAAFSDALAKFGAALAAAEVK